MNINGVTVTPLQLALVYGRTLQHLKKGNPQLSIEQLSSVALRLLPTVIAELYKTQVNDYIAEK